MVKSKGPTLLGLQTSRKLGLVTLNFTIGTKIAEQDHTSSTAATESKPEGDVKERERILKEFADMFKGIGCLTGEYSIKIDPSVPPVIHPPHRVPIALKEKFKELDSLQGSLADQDIITPVTKPTSWVNSFVCVTKNNGSVRLCLDPNDVNKAMMRPHFVTPTFEEIISRLHGAKWFSIVNVKSGYWNMKLDEKSSELTTFITPEGRYMFKRFPMGVKSAQDKFQRAIFETFGSSRMSSQYLMTPLLLDLRRMAATMTKHSRNSCAQETSFFGHIITRNGVKPVPKKIEAIVQMKPPKDKKQLASFLGLANY